MKNKAFINKKCVACGCCLKICPFTAISITYGTIAKVDRDKCVGCGRCEKICPAGIISIMEENTYDKEVV